jgi:hypothetical protein
LEILRNEGERGDSLHTSCARETAGKNPGDQEKRL